MDQPDTDNSNFTYNLSDSTESNFVHNVSIDANGNVYLVSGIDYESITAAGDGQQKMVNITVIAVDHGTPALSGTTTIQMFIRVSYLF